VITGSPLLHFVDGTKLLLMPDGSSQPLLKHCFGHDDSTLLLCPYAPGVTLIRQSATKRNVRVQWAPDGQLNHRGKVLEESADALLNYRRPVTALDYIALTDIRAGDEFFLDFGHNASQSKQTNTTKYAFLEHASYWNQPAAVGAIILRTQDEQVNNPYPVTVTLQCHAAVLELKEASSALEWTEEKALPCQVTERYVDPATAYITYAVKVFSRGSWNGFGGVPRRYIRFVNVPVTTVKAMPLPDDIFPHAWRSRQDSHAAAESQEKTTRENTI
jgi:hypothetical protein